MKEKVSKIFKDLKEGELSLEKAEQQVLDLFAVNGSLYPSIEQRWEAAEFDMRRQKSYDAAYDRKRGFIEGVKWLQKWLLK